MNLVVCLKQVPENPKIEVDPQTGALIGAKGKLVINPFDMYALEEGIRTKEKHGGKVTAITMGPPEAEEALREAIALGIDQVIRLSHPLFEGSDTLATSYILAKAVGKLEQPDIIICGRQTTDGDTGQVAPQLAEWLGLPFVSYVSQIENIGDRCMVVRRMVDEGHQIVEMSLPGVISVVKEINVPRLPSLRGLMQSKKVQIPVWGVPELGLDVTKVGPAGSPTRMAMVSFPAITRQGEMLQGSLESQVDQLIERLRTAKVV
ncbi:MAG: electron transfer flavoprotein subunit beta [Chloroflexi bacterium RBG_13_54_8]|nr:MAG: electron transfer flavoprotein subunit beta [Chloroflexi bacterium RBG_13_54_8]